MSAERGKQPVHNSYTKNRLWLIRIYGGVTANVLMTAWQAIVSKAVSKDGSADNSSGWLVQSFAAAAQRLCERHQSSTIKTRFSFYAKPHKLIIKLSWSRHVFNWFSVQAYRAATDATKQSQKGTPAAAAKRIAFIGELHMQSRDNQPRAIFWRKAFRLLSRDV